MLTIPDQRSKVKLIRGFNSPIPVKQWVLYKTGGFLCLGYTDQYIDERLILNHFDTCLLLQTLLTMLAQGAEPDPFRLMRIEDCLSTYVQEVLEATELKLLNMEKPSNVASQQLTSLQRLSNITGTTRSDTFSPLCLMAHAGPTCINFWLDIYVLESLITGILTEGHGAIHPDNVEIIKNDWLHLFEGRLN